MGDPGGQGCQEGIDGKGYPGGLGGSKGRRSPGESDSGDNGK